MHTFSSRAWCECLTLSWQSMHRHNQQTRQPPSHNGQDLVSTEVLCQCPWLWIAPTSSQHHLAHHQLPSPESWHRAHAVCRHPPQRDDLHTCWASFHAVGTCQRRCSQEDNSLTAPESTSMSTIPPSRTLGTPTEQISSPVPLGSWIPSLTLPESKWLPIAPTTVVSWLAVVKSSTAWTFFLGHWDDMCPFSPQFQHVLTVPGPLPPLPFLPPPLALGCGVPRDRHALARWPSFPHFRCVLSKWGQFAEVWSVFPHLGRACCVWLLCSPPPFAPLPPLLGVPLLMASTSIGVDCVWAAEIAREIATTSLLKYFHFSKCQHASANGFSVVIQVIWAQTFQSWFHRPTPCHCPVRMWLSRVPRLWFVRSCRP